ncbi:response regulator [Desulfobacterales bacterium HSG16]|nr:response regulator [Desulfobacterales bacterium HSG16]
MDKTVLLVDDDKKLTSLLKEYLEGNGFEVFIAGDGSEIIQKLENISPDMVILDIMMPGPDGLDVLKEIRRIFDLPVIMLTARRDETDRIVGLELGADDYLPKPFNPRELLARMKAVLRRVPADGVMKPSGGQVKNGENDGMMITLGGITLDGAKRVLCMGKENVDLSAVEFDLLKVLMSRPDTILTRDQLMNLARGKDYMAFDRSIDVHISKLRTKLAKHPSGKDRIKTVWGTGYMFLEKI